MTMMMMMMMMTTDGSGGKGGGGAEDDRNCLRKVSLSDKTTFLLSRTVQHSQKI
jgi:hypothetical protein